MNKLSLLDKFLSKTDTRVKLRVPFTIGDFTYSTSGYACIRFPVIHEFKDSVADGIKADLLFDRAKNDVEMLPLSEVFPKPDIEYKKCDRCESVGYSTFKICPECEGKVHIEIENDHSTYDVVCQTCDIEDDCSDGYVYETDWNRESACDCCKGLGKVPVKRFMVSSSELFDFDINVIDLLHFYDLPNVKIGLTKSDCQSYFYLTFDGGEGVVSTRTR